MKIDIRDIVVPDGRFRSSLLDIDKLALSISKVGLIHPIVVKKMSDGRYELIAGQRRLEACKIIKYEQIDATLRDELTDLEKREIELEENISRVDMNWPEIIKGKKEIDEIKRKLYGWKAYDQKEGWSVADTAEALGESEGTLRHDLMLAKAIEVMPELTKLKTKADAMKRLQQEKKKMVREELVRRADTSMKEGGDEFIKVIHGDAIKVLPDITNGSVDLIIFDPPFGVGLDSMARACDTPYEGYKDSEEDMFEKVRLISRECKRILKPSAHMYMFFPIGVNYPFFLKIMQNTVDVVDPIPINWNKRTGGFTVNQEYRYTPHYQPVFFGRNGDKKLTQGMGNILEVSPIRHKEHVAEMPAELMEILIEQSSLPGEMVVDPCAGSGPTLVAAKRLKRRALGIEIDNDNVNLIKSRLMEV